MSTKARLPAVPRLLALLLALLLAPPGPAGHAETPMHTPTLAWAAMNGQTRIAEILIAQGVSLKETDHLGNTPLHLAVSHPELLKLLLDSGAEVNARNYFGDTPLHLAVDSSRRSVELLLAAGADVSAKNFFGRTPLDNCLWNGNGPYNLAIAELLIQAGGRRR